MMGAYRKYIRHLKRKCVVCGKLTSYHGKDKGWKCSRKHE